MKLIHVKKVKQKEYDPRHPNAEQFVLQVCDEEGVFETFPANEFQIEILFKNAVAGMMAFRPMKESLPLECRNKVVAKTMKNGIGLTDDHKQFIHVKNGEVHVLESGLRWMVALEMQLVIGRAIIDRSFLRSIF